MKAYEPNYIEMLNGIAIYNILSWTADTKHGRLISDKQTIEEVKDKLDQLFQGYVEEWLATAKVSL